MLIGVNLLAQQEQVKLTKKTPFDIAIGNSWSGIDFQMYSQQKRAKPGANLKLIYHVNPGFKIMAEYTSAFMHTDAPSWNFIKANSIDLNACVVGSINESEIGFYAFTGFSMLNWKGMFTGFRDEKNDGILLAANEKLEYTKLMANIGMGFERSFKHFSVFGETKIRFAKGNDKEVKVVINDVYYCFGITTPIVFPIIKKKQHETIIKKQPKLLKRKGNDFIPGKKYHWFKRIPN